MKGPVQIGLALAVGFVVGYVLANVNTRSDDTHHITPGSEIVGIADDHVLILSYTGKGMTLTAQRSTPGADFNVQATFVDGRGAQRCTAPPDLGGQLATFSSLIAKREISVEERDKEFPVHVGNLTVQPWGDEPNYPMMVFTNKAGTSVAFVFDRYLAELTIPLAAFKRLETGCAELGRK